MSLAVVILVQAAFYALLGLGYVLIYRATRVLNLAMGDIMVFGAFAFYQGLVWSGGSMSVGTVVAIMASMLLGALVYYAVLRPLAGFPTAVGVLATIAVGISLRSVTTGIWSGQTKYPAELLGPEVRGMANLIGAPVSMIDIAMVAIAIALLVGIPAVLQRAAVGVNMRGTAENVLLASQRGININHVNALSWAIAAAVAATAGVFFALKVRLGPDIWYVGLAGFAPALIGGMDSIKGLALGAIIVAAAEVLAARYLAPQTALAAPFLVLLIALWIRPWGFFGSHEELERI